jgi:hypothetical protein
MKENKLAEKIIDFLGDKIVTKRVVKSVDLHQIFYNMGIIEDIPIMEKIIDYLDENNIDISFDESDREFHQLYKHVVGQLKIVKSLGKKKSHIHNLLSKMENVNVKQRPNWLEDYRNDEEGELPRINNSTDLVAELTKKYKEDIRTTIENTPNPNIFDILKNNE